MNSEHEITNWTVTKWNCMEHDVYFDPPDNPNSSVSQSGQYTKSGFRISDSTSWIFDSSADHDGKIVLLDANAMKETVIDVEMDGKWRRFVIDNNGQHWEEIGPDYWHSQEYLQIRAAYIRAKRRRKIQAKQKRAAFRRLKRGLA